MTSINEIEIAKAYTPFLGGRWKADGPGSGQEFRETFLEPALKAGDRLKVVLAGAYGYPISFLEEAFGGLIRVGFAVADLKERLHIEAGEDAFDAYVDEIWQLVEEEAKHEAAKLNA